jgi:hypothetical protein
VSISNYYGGVRKVVILLSTAAVLASGCGSKPKRSTAQERALDQGAARFVVRTQANLKLGKFSLAWRSLHPAQRRVVSAARLASCYPRGAYPGTVTFRATEVRDVSWTVPGTTAPTDAKEVTVTARSAGRLLDTFNQHVVRVGGKWTWMLSRTFFGRAKSGAC